MSIVAEQDYLNALSGKYVFHVIKNNQPAYIREDGHPASFSRKRHYLVYNTYNNTTEWNIQSDPFFMEGKAGGIFRNATSGK